MTKLMAGLAASAVGLLLRDPLDGAFGTIVGETLGFVIGVGVYLALIRFLSEVRDK